MFVRPHTPIVDCPLAHGPSPRPSCALPFLFLQVARSVEFVQSGVTHLQSAKATQRKTRKWMCCALILGIIIIIAVVIATVGVVHGF